MGNYDGSHLGIHTKKGKNFIKTAANLLEHCELVSETSNKKVKDYLDGLSVDTHGEGVQNIETPFEYIKGSFIQSSQSSSYAKAYIIRNKKSIVIAFRGSGVKKKDRSKDLKGIWKNAVADGRIKLIKNEYFPGLIHEGFSDEYMELRQKILDIFKEITSNIKGGRGGSMLQGRAVYITGFSLGAALANLCAYDLMQVYNIQAHVYLFAQPAVGDHRFARNFEEKIETTFRFAHEKDVVAQVPHCIFNEYKAPGKKLFVFNTDGKEVHHDDIKIMIKANRISIIGKLNPKAFQAAIIIAIVKAAHSFSQYHHPRYYKKRLVKLHRNYEANILKNSMIESAEKQYSQCQKYALNIKKGI